MPWYAQALVLTVAAVLLLLTDIAEINKARPNNTPMNMKPVSNSVYKSLVTRR
jgi:hypothetical protein